MRSPKIRKKTAFVPRIIFRAATVAGVVPLCAVACFSSPDVVGVACVGFDGGPCGPGDGGGGDAHPLTDAHMTSEGVAARAFEAGVADSAFFVAAIGFDSGDARGVADTGPGDVTLGVAAHMFAKDAGNSG
jgi:hypothetical protein